MRRASWRHGWRSTTNSDLAVVLLAELPTVLRGEADRMLALLRKAGVPSPGSGQAVDDPDLDRAMTLDRRQDLIAYRAHHAFVRPGPLTHEVQQGLMLSRRSNASRGGGKRLDALALDRHQQTETIVLEGPAPIRMPEGCRKGLDLGLKTVFTLVRHVPFQPCDELELGHLIESPKRLCDSLRLGSGLNQHQNATTAARATAEA